VAAILTLNKHKNQTGSECTGTTLVGLQVCRKVSWVLITDQLGFQLPRKKERKEKSGYNLNRLCKEEHSGPRDLWCLANPSGEIGGIIPVGRYVPWKLRRQQDRIPNHFSEAQTLNLISRTAKSPDFASILIQVISSERICSSGPLLQGSNSDSGDDRHRYKSVRAQK